MDGINMDKNLFFKPTILYKEYMILDLIEKNSKITQREISLSIGVAVSMVNFYIDSYEEKGLIKRTKHSTKNVEYFVTEKGLQRNKLLNIWYLKSSQDIYSQAKDNVVNFLNQIIDKGFNKILLYGAGEVAEIMLQVIHNDNSIPLEVIAVIDDDKSKQNEMIIQTPIFSIDEIKNIKHDGILISSYKHHEIIQMRLENIHYNNKNVINFF
jgi:DNA-binding MarR family transcriptional regulator